MNKEAIIAKLDEAAGEFAACCSTISDEDFFRQPPEKWSVAQNVKHLITSAKMTRLAYGLPKFIIRIYTGKPNRPSRSYEELVTKYKTKLQQGGKASGRFIPEKIDPDAGKEKWLQGFNDSIQKLIRSMDKWKDNDLDKYLAPHPLLGKITQRELGYFTIYHTLHHLAIIKDRLSDYHPEFSPPGY